MREFRDDQGRPWQVALTVTAVGRVRDQVTIDVDGQKKPFKIDDVSTLGETLRVLETDTVILGETLHAILCKQIEEKGLSKDQFCDGLRGDALSAAFKALVDELVDFFPQRQRPLAKSTAEAHEVLWDGTLAQVRETVAQIMTQSGMRSGKPQESSESIQESGHSGSSSQPAMAA